MRVLLRALTCAMLVSGAGLMAQTARIKGLIQTEDGTALTGSKVLVVRTTVPPFNSTLVTGKDGSFDAAGLPAGTYRICPDLPSSQYLSPCLWYDPNAIVAVQDGQEVDNVSITLRQGSTVTVAVDDPVGLMQATHKAGDPPQMLFVAIKGPKKIPYPLVGGTRSGNKTIYQMTVPFDAPLKLIVLPLGLSASDDLGSDVPDKGKIYEFVHTKSGSKPGNPGQGASNPGSEQNPTSFQFSVRTKGN